MMDPVYSVDIVFNYDRTILREYTLDKMARNLGGLLERLRN